MRQTPGENEAFRNDGLLTFSSHAGGDLATTIIGQGIIDTDYDGDGDIDNLAANRNGDFAILNNDCNGNFFALA